MASIRYNPNGQKGRISYNTDIVSGIIALSLQETEGIELVPSRSKGIKVNFEKEGIFADISVIAHYGYIAKVDVHIQSVVFPEAAPPAPPAAENQEQQENK